VKCGFVCESSVEVEPGGKCCKVSWFITVTRFRICTVMFVLLTDCVNITVMPAVVIVMNNEKCAMRIYPVCLCSILKSVL
jgi:hypothetical protein